MIVFALGRKPVILGNAIFSDLSTSQNQNSFFCYVNPRNYVQLAIQKITRTLLTLPCKSNLKSFFFLEFEAKFIVLILHNHFKLKIIESFSLQNGLFVIKLKLYLLSTTQSYFLKKTYSLIIL